MNTLKQKMIRIVVLVSAIFVYSILSAGLSDVAIPVSGKIVKNNRTTYIVEDKLVSSSVTYVIKGSTFGLERKAGYNVTVLGVVKDTKRSNVKEVRIKKVISAKKESLLGDMGKKTKVKKPRKKGSLVDEMTKGRKSLID